MGVRISEHFGGAYLSGPDIPVGKSFRLQAGDCRIESFEDGDKIVLAFLNARKSLCLNKTNASVLAAAWGDDTEGWYGRWLELFSVPTTYNGRTYNGLRVRPIEPPPSHRDIPDPPPPAPPAPAPTPVGVPASQTREAMQRGHENPADVPF